MAFTHLAIKMSFFRPLRKHLFHSEMVHSYGSTEDAFQTFRSIIKFDSALVEIVDLASQAIWFPFTEIALIPVKAEIICISLFVNRKKLKRALVISSTIRHYFGFLFCNHTIFFTLRVNLTIKGLDGALFFDGSR